MPENKDIDVQTEEIKVFLSYARYDEKNLKFIDAFKESMEYYILNLGGINIKVFLDTDSIGWGEAWQQKIENEVNAATVFIPLLSATYIARKNCRQEFFRFYQTADRLGVTELILPVLLFEHSDLFVPDSSDELVSICSKLNWESIAEAIIEGNDSPVWGKTMAHLARRFTAAYKKAEQTISEDNRARISAVNEAERDQDSPGFIEAVGNIEEEVTALVALTEQVTERIKSIGNVANSGNEIRPTNIREANIWAIRLADNFKEPCAEIGEYGKTIFVKTQKIDLNIGRVMTIANKDENFFSFAGGFIKSLDNLEEVKGQLNSLLNSFESVENMSAAIRKSLRPAREGLKAIIDSIDIMNTWSGFLEDRQLGS